MADNEYYQDPYFKALVATKQFYQILTNINLGEALEYAVTMVEDRLGGQINSDVKDAEKEAASKSQAECQLAKDNIIHMDQKTAQHDQAYQGLATWAESWKAMIKYDKQPHSLPADLQVVIASMQKKVRQEQMDDRDEYLVGKYNSDLDLCQKLQAYAYFQVPVTERKDNTYKESYKAQQQKGHDSLRNRLLEGSEIRNGCISIIKDILTYCYNAPIPYSTDTAECMIAELRVQIRQHCDHRSALTHYYSAADLIKASIVCEVAEKITHPYYRTYQRLEQHYQQKDNHTKSFKQYLDNRINKHWHKIADNFYNIIGKYADDQEVKSLQEQLKYIEHKVAIVNIIGILLGVLCIAAGLLIYHQAFFPLASAGGTLIFLTISSIMAESLPYLSIKDNHDPATAEDLSENRGNHDPGIRTEARVAIEMNKSLTPPPIDTH